jgi:cbb3-type cytochrome oxidase maturation protein
MSVIYVLLTISIVVAVVFFAAFIFSVKSGQYDDSYTPSVRMLFEDELVVQKDKKILPNDKNELPISKRKQL